MSDPMLKLDSVLVDYGNGRYPQRRPLDNLTLEVSPGELVVILGNSGAGKSTLLHVVAGFLSPGPAEQGGIVAKIRNIGGLSTGARVEGRVYLNGQDITSWEPRCRDVGLVMQKFNLYDHWNIRKNLEFPLRMRGVQKSNWQALINDVIERLDIDPRQLNDRPRNLSGGQEQRVAIGKMLLKDPSVALFDEAFSNLDWDLRRTLRDEIVADFLKKSTERRGRCVLFVTHDLEDAKRADKIVFLRSSRRSSGRIVTEHRLFSSGAEPDETAWRRFEREIRHSKAEIVSIHEQNGESSQRRLDGE